MPQPPSSGHPWVAAVRGGTAWGGTHHWDPWEKIPGLGVSHPIVSHPIVSYPGVSHPILSHPSMSHPIVSCFCASHPSLSHPGASHPGVSHPIVSHPIVSHSDVSHPKVPSQYVPSWCVPAPLGVPPPPPSPLVAARCRSAVSQWPLADSGGMAPALLRTGTLLTGIPTNWDPH